MFGFPHNIQFDSKNTAGHHLITEKGEWARTAGVQQELGSPYICHVKEEEGFFTGTQHRCQCLVTSSAQPVVVGHVLEILSLSLSAQKCSV